MRYLWALLLPPVAVWNSQRPFQAILNVPLCLMGWVPGVIHALVVTARGPLLSKPEQITEFILDNFPKVTTTHYQRFEKALARGARGSQERELVYALRVSSVVQTVASMKTLASRWSTAHSGAGGAGLFVAQEARNYQRVCEFLTQLYREQFHRLLHEEFSAYDQKRAMLQTENARHNHQTKFRDRLSTYRTLFVPELQGADSLISQYDTAAQ